MSSNLKTFVTEVLWLLKKATLNRGMHNAERVTARTSGSRVISLSPRSYYKTLSSMSNQRKIGKRTFSPVSSFITLVVFGLTFHPASSEILSGSIAKCPVEGQLIHLPILASSPCIECRCKSGSVSCSRNTCPEVSCKNALRRVKGECCPICQESSECNYHGQTYQAGQSWFEENCQVCRCAGGNVTCEKQKCSKDLSCPKGQKPGILPGACCLQCIEETGVCTSYGDPHYETFDGQMYNFHGSCRYQLTSDCRHSNFSVRLRNEKDQSGSSTWTKSLTIHIRGTVVSLHKDLEVKVNRSKVKLPFYSLPHLQITKENFMLTMVTSIGLEISWDGNGYIEVHAPKSYKGHLCGMCGNFNGAVKDDFLLRNGKMATSASEFGKGWAIGRRKSNCVRAPAPTGESTISKCRSQIRVYWRAHKRCWPIRKQFSSCHSKVKPDTFYWSCIADVCQCSGRRCECEALLAYARTCRREGVALNWGRKNACGVSCKGGAVFDDCVPSCQRTCETKDDPELTCASSPCVPGCRCPAGTIWNNARSKCIQQWMCPVQLSSMQIRKFSAYSSKKNRER